MTARKPAAATAKKTPAKKAPARKPKAVPTPPVEEVAETPSRWASLKAEAARIKAQSGLPDTSSVEPYVIDAYDPPILISYPNTVEQQLALTQVVNLEDGTFNPRDIVQILQGIIGRRQWPAVYALIRDEEPEMLLALLSELQEHFDGTPGVGGNDVPGKSRR